MFLPVITGLQKFSVDMARKRASIPKYQVYNNALLSVLSGLSFKEAVTDSKRWGQFFESAIGAYIILSLIHISEPTRHVP